MKPIKRKKYLDLYILSFLLIFLCSCCNNSNDETMFESTLQKHIDAVANKDIDYLKSTMSTEGDMQLILPNSEIIYGVDKFIDLHIDWFKDTTWTYEAEIVDMMIGSKYGSAVTEVIYKEPDRNGKPYYNHMIVSYVLEKSDGQWYIVLDHASSISKSTD